MPNNNKDLVPGSPYAKTFSEAGHAQQAANRAKEEFHKERDKVKGK